MSATARSSAWQAYLSAERDRGPRALLGRALDRFDADTVEPRLALDLGCGIGCDTVELLRRGWRVVAIDHEPAAVAAVNQRTPAADRARLRAVTADFTVAELPPADLVYCGWSLPHCPPDRFASLWRRLRVALRPGGRLAVHLLGNRDGWAQRERMTAVTRTRLADLFAGLSVETLIETDNESTAFEGPKHWHYFEVIARR